MLQKIKPAIDSLKNNTLLHNSLKIMFLRVVGICFLFGFTLFLTRNYDAKIVGQYEFIRIFLLAIGTFSLVGTEQSILYFAGIIQARGNNRNLKEIYYKIVKIIFISSICVLVLFLLVGKNTINTFFNDELMYVVLLKSSLILFFFNLTLFNTEFFRALNQTYTAEIFRNILKYVSVFIGSIFLFYFDKQEYLIDTFLIGFILLSFVSYLMIKHSLNQQIKKHTINIVNSNFLITSKEIIKKSYPMAMSGLFFFLLLSFDVMFLKKYYGNEEVAYYSTAIKLSTFIAMIILSLNISIASKISEFYVLKKNIELKNLIKKTSRIIFSFSLLITLPLVFFSKEILTNFGNHYERASTPLIIIILGQGFCSLFGVVSIYFNMTEKQKVFTFIMFCAVLINFITNFILVPKYGMNGAAISFVLSMLFWNLASIIYAYLKDKILIFI
jgi:O-antigen/teichoic acid export membrane protein